MVRKPYILITNDDGIYSPGIKQLWKSLSQFATCIVVAPASEQSAVSLSITLRQPLKIEKITWTHFSEAKTWAVNGTPADCVKLALNVIATQTPDLIVSGINRGTNAGRNVLYSGTIAAIIEGVLHDIPGIAFSLGNYLDPNFEQVDPYIIPIVRYLLDHPLRNGCFLNVNFPHHPRIAGVRMARQGKEYLAENPEKRDHPYEGSYYWLGTRLAEFEEDENSDILWLKKGYATAVPIQVCELSDLSHIQLHKDHFETCMPF